MYMYIHVISDSIKMSMTDVYVIVESNNFKDLEQHLILRPESLGIFLSEAVRLDNIPMFEWLLDYIIVYFFCTCNK